MLQEYVPACSVRVVRMRSRVCEDEKAQARETGGEKLRHGSRLLSRRGVMAKVTVTKQKATHLQIANRAFEIYVSRGGDHGHDVGDWFEAERQLQTELQRRSRRSSKPRREGSRCLSAAAQVSHPG